MMNKWSRPNCVDLETNDQEWPQSWPSLTHCAPFLKKRLKRQFPVGQRTRLNHSNISSIIMTHSFLRYNYLITWCGRAWIFSCLEIVDFRCDPWSSSIRHRWSKSRPKCARDSDPTASVPGRGQVWWTETALFVIYLNALVKVKNTSCFCSFFKWPFRGYRKTS